MKSVKVDLWLGVSVLLYALVYSAILCLRYYNFHLGGMDLSNYTQAIWKIANGMPPIVTAIASHTLVDHFTLIWYPIALAFKILPSPYFIIILHSFSIALVAVVIYQLGKEVLADSNIAFLMALSYLFSHYTQRVLFSLIHPESFESLFIILALLFIVREKRWLYFLFFCLSLVSNEDVGLYFIPVGIFIIMEKKQKTTGLLTVLLSVAWIIFVVKIKPFIGPDTQNHLNRFSHLGSTPVEIIHNVLFKPWLLAVTLLQSERIGAVSQMLLQAGFFSLATWWGAFLIAAPLLFKSLTNHRGMYQFWDHYSMVVLPFIWFAAIMGLNRFLHGDKLQGYIRNPKRFVKAMMLGVLVLNVTIQAFMPYSPLSFKFDWRLIVPNPVAKDGWEVISKIPATRSVLTQEYVSQALSTRPELYAIHYPGQFINGGLQFKQIDYALFNKSDFRGNWLENDLVAAESYFGSAPEYNRVHAKGSWVLYKRR